MQEEFNLTEYLSDGIKTLIKNIVKVTHKNPKESAFLLQYAAAARKAGKRRAAAEKNGEHIPPFLIASITGKCNLRCVGCYAQANGGCAQSEMDAPEWERIFKEANALGIGIILLAGGEPFLRFDVLTKAAGFPEILFPIFTNGTVLGEQEYALLHAYRNIVPILSIEGDEAVTEARRGAGVYAQLMRTMKTFNETDILFGASVTVTRTNLDMVTDDAFVDELYQKGCKVVFYIEYVPVEKEELALTDAERETLESRLLTLREREMIFISFPGDEKAMGGCLAAGRGFFHIAANGAAEPCPFSPYSDTNLRNLPLKDALQSPLFTKLIDGGILQANHTGGCVLFEQKETVGALTV